MQLVARCLCMLKANTFLFLITWQLGTQQANTRSGLPAFSAGGCTCRLNHRHLRYVMC